MKIVSRHTDHFSHEALKPVYIVLHTCAFRPEFALSELEKLRVSAHYFLPDPNFVAPDEYPIYRLVDESKVAWHAGQSSWQGEVGINAKAIGIEFNVAEYANGLAVEDELADIDFYSFSDFSPIQVSAGIELIKDLMLSYNIKPENVIAHADIAPWRIENEMLVSGKTDPGPLFPWKKLAENGVSIWPSTKRHRTTAMDVTWKNFQSLAIDFGYALDLTGRLDFKTQQVFTVFMWRFFPEDCLERKKNIPEFNLSEKNIIALENLVDNIYVNRRQSS